VSDVTEQSLRDELLPTGLVGLGSAALNEAVVKAQIVLGTDGVHSHDVESPLCQPSMRHPAPSNH
jgi:hypothetical protein